jgi:hypothetical protein
MYVCIWWGQREGEEEEEEERHTLMELYSAATDEYNPDQYLEQHQMKEKLAYSRKLTELQRHHSVSDYPTEEALSSAFA